MPATTDQAPVVVASTDSDGLALTWFTDLAEATSGTDAICSANSDGVTVNGPWQQDADDDTRMTLRRVGKRIVAAYREGTADDDTLGAIVTTEATHARGDDGGLTAVGD